MTFAGALTGERGTACRGRFVGLLSSHWTSQRCCRKSILSIAMSRLATTPQATLRKQSKSLRAALDAALQKPVPEHVHQLRISICRIEALLAVIPLLPKAPAIAAQSKRFLKAAKPIRRFAGKLRDLDVHATHLDKLSKAFDTRALAKALGRKRDRQAKRLREFLQKRQKKLVTALDELEAALYPARNLSITPIEADRLSRRWFADAAANLSPSKPVELHDLRKAAKLARYIAEAGSRSGGSPTSRRFRRLQQSIGEWRDWLTFTDFARQYLPASSPVLTSLKQQRDHLRQDAVAVVSQQVSVKNRAQESGRGVRNSEH